MCGVLYLVALSYLTLCDPMYYNPPGSSVHGDSPGKNTGVGCHALLQGIVPIQGSNPDLPYCRWILYHLSHQGSPRILESVAYLFSRGTPHDKNWTGISYIAGRFFTNWATMEANIEAKEPPNSQNALWEEEKNQRTHTYQFKKWLPNYSIQIECIGIETFSSAQFSHSVLSNSLQPHGLHHARLPCPSPTPRACTNSGSLSRWCHPTISSSVIPFSSHLQSFAASGSFLVSQFFASGGQNIGISASASVLPVNVQGWFPLELTGMIFLKSKGLSRVFSNTTIQKHQFFSIHLSF